MSSFWMSLFDGLFIHNHYCLLYYHELTVSNNYVITHVKHKFWHDYIYLLFLFSTTTIQKKNLSSLKFINTINMSVLMRKNQRSSSALVPAWLEIWQKSGVQTVERVAPLGIRGPLQGVPQYQWAS